MTTAMSPYQQFIHQTRYARWLETEKRRETWEETVTRYIEFFKQEKANTPELKALLDECKQYILDMKVMPSMRALMTAGEALKRENIAGFNCSYIAINNKRAFSEALYILMCGTGVGFSCERQEVAKLPVVPESLQPSEDVIVVGDSKEGWAKAYAKLLSALYSGDIPKIDYSKLRPAGARLKTFGGRACLTGDTKVYRSGKKTRGHLELTINDLMDMKHKSNHWKRIKLRSVNEQTGELYYNQLVDIIDNGIAPVYKLVTENGYCIKATDTHRFMDSTGEWKQLKNFTIGEEITVNGSEKKTGNCADCGVEVSRRAKRCKFCHDQTRIKADALDTTARQRKHNRNYCKDYCEKCGITDTRFEVHHIDKNPLNNEHSNLLNLCSPCHQLIHAQERTLGDGFSHRYITWDKIISITLIGEERVYDLSMQTPDHNFIANGIVSHNSGSKPLQKLFEFTINKFKHSLGKKLTSIDVHDILCMVGEIVVVGGVRRSALISLSNLSDQRMRDAKSGQWWIDNPQRGLANNSVAYTEKPSAEIFMEEWLALVKSKSGERGIFNRVAAQNQAAKYGRRNPNMSFGVNPCAEIILRDKQFCNLTEVIVREGDDISILSQKVRIATILGTFQASLTKFNFLSETWTKNTEEEALLGVSMTGIMDNLITSGQGDKKYLEQMLDYLREGCVAVNKTVAEMLGIKPSAAITCVKPSGTVSQLCDTASGIHARHNHHYIRTVRIDKKDPVYALLKHQGVPIEDDAMRPDSTAVVSFPQVAPKGCITRNDMTAIEQLELWLIYQRNWCEHKPSVTITVKEHEWIAVGAWVYEHFDEVSGISFLPHSDHTYQQAPYQDMTEESLNQWIKDNPSPDIDWSLLPMFEKEDETVSSQTLACVGGVCDIL